MMTPSPARRFIVAALLPFVVTVPATQVAADEAHIRITVEAVRGNAVDEDASDATVALFSHHGGLDVVERRHVSAILDEKALSLLVEPPNRRRAFAELYGVDYFVWLTVPATETEMPRLEIVGARDGAELLVRALGSRSLPAYGEEAASIVEHFALEGSKGQQELSGAIAFAPTDLETDDAALKVRASSVLAEIQRELLLTGSHLLHRRFIRAALDEATLAEGMLLDSRDPRSIAGARFVVRSKLSRRRGSVEVLQLRILDARTRAAVSANQFLLTAPSSEEPDSLADAARWIRENTSSHRSVEQPSASAPVQAPASEGIDFLLTGIRLVLDDRPFEALRYFQSAHALDPGLTPALDWSAEALDRTGFPEAAAGMRSCDRHGGPEVAPGLLFLGVSSDADLALDQASLSLALLGASSEAIGGPVVLVEDLAELRDEYDILVGRPEAVGVHWRDLSPLLAQRVFAAELSRDGDVLELLMHVADIGAPQHQRSIRVSLEPDRAAWPAQLRRAIGELAAQRPGSGRPARVVPTETREQLRLQLDTALRSSPQLSLPPDAVLKLLSLDATQVQYLPRLMPGAQSFQVCLRSGMRSWAGRSLADDPRFRSWLELERVSDARAGGGFNLDDARRVWEAIVRRELPSPERAIAAYNLTLADLNADNRTAALRALTEQIEGGGLPGDLMAAAKHARAALQLSLGLPSDEREQGVLRGFITVAQQEPREGRSGGFLGVAAPPTPFAETLLLADDNDRQLTKADITAQLSVLPAYLRGQLLPSMVVRPLTESGESLALLGYAAAVLSAWHAAAVNEDTRPLLGAYIEAVNHRLDSADSIPPDGLDVLLEPLHGDRVFGRLDPKRDAALFQRRDAIQAKVLAIVGKHVEREADEWHQAPCFFGPYPGGENAIPSRDGECAEVYRADAARRSPACPMLSRSWRVFERWNRNARSAEVQADAYLPYYDGCRRHFARVEHTSAAAAAYAPLGGVMFRAGRFALAADVFSDLLGWHDRFGNTADPDLHANALYALARIEQANRDLPAALERAKSALDEARGRRFRVQPDLGPDQPLDRAAAALLAELRRR